MNVDETWDYHLDHETKCSFNDSEVADLAKTNQNQMISWKSHDHYGLGFYELFLIKMR